MLAGLAGDEPFAPTRNSQVLDIPGDAPWLEGVGFRPDGDARNVSSGAATQRVDSFFVWTTNDGSHAVRGVSTSLGVG